MLEWYGKPHRPIFDQAMKALEQNTGRTNWNSDRIGNGRRYPAYRYSRGQRHRLRTVLITGHGLFRDGSAADAIAETGIAPNYLVDTDVDRFGLA